MKLIVGLGNPGRFYAFSRHNVGFMAADEFCRAQDIILKNDSAAFSLSGRGRVAGKDVLVARPLTFMNLSGVSLKLLLRKHKVSLDDLLVICDDLDLEFGRLKIKPSGSSGGHRGLESIIEAIESREFCRLRIGIGRPRREVDAAEYVLSNFIKQERAELKDVLARSCDCCRTWISEGITRGMEIFNRRSNAG